MNWKDVLTILGFFIGFYVAFVSPRFEGLENRMDSIESSIKELSNDIKNDRRAMNQRIDRLYQMHTIREDHK